MDILDDFLLEHSPLLSPGLPSQFSPHLAEALCSIDYPLSPTKYCRRWHSYSRLILKARLHLALFSCFYEPNPFPLFVLQWASP